MLFLTGRRTTLKVRARCMVLRWKVLLPVLALGVSPFIMQSTESLLSVVLNTSLLKYGGDVAVGPTPLIASIMQVINLPLQGLTQGAQPITSFNYGAGNMDRVRKSVRLLLTCCLTYSCLFWLCIMLIPQVFIGIFSSDPELMDTAVWAARIFLFGCFAFGAQTGFQQSFLALGQAKGLLAAGPAAEDCPAHPPDLPAAPVLPRQALRGVCGGAHRRHSGRFPPPPCPSWCSPKRS